MRLLSLEWVLCHQATQNRASRMSLKPGSITLPGLLTSSEAKKNSLKMELLYS